MPIYEYMCTKCGHQSEALQKFSDPPLVECEICHGRIKKLISHSTFHLKGTGWYVTDYAHNSGGAHDMDTKPKSQTKSEKADRVAKKTQEKKKDTPAATGK